MLSSVITRMKLVPTSPSILQTSLASMQTGQPHVLLTPCYCDLKVALAAATKPARRVTRTTAVDRVSQEIRA